MKNIAIIPARSGSKGLQDKNIRIMNGKPLIAYTIEAAIKSECFDEIMVSTDSEEYAEISKEYGASVPFLRNEINSGDKASSWEVVREVLNKYKDLGCIFDVVALLQPTSPLRTEYDIREGYNILINKDANSVVSICEVEHSPLWMNTIPKDMAFNQFLDKNIMGLSRQSLETYYRVNGAIYIMKSEWILNNKDIDLYDYNSFSFIMDKKNSVDIDDFYDFKIAEMFIKEKDKVYE